MGEETKVILLQFIEKYILENIKRLLLTTTD